ncbi:DUF885 domain-containing protein [Hyphobacterium marinum]|uniref:DUF885 domain-containing protein n=1 Tax=Hyphobacterium marinum TaxID=3116574 RepID=A0ABU7LZC1_9PROT|nr:DUF885 domain-containing protein [Hyphobacterium sp. Y6023]MEE2566899.1 DUF885 domain-containing protein [Hyphobacterium sp. Y6023]
MKRFLISTASAIVALGGVSAGAFAETLAAASSVQSEAEQTESDRLNARFAEIFDADLQLFPLAKTGQGIIDEDYGRWNNPSDAFGVEMYELGQARLTHMRETFDFDALDASAQISYRLFEYEAERARASFPFRRHGIIFNQLFGPHTGTVAILSGQHRISEVSHADAYIQRIEGVDEFLDVLIEESETRAGMGIVAPEWVYDRVLQTVRALASGAPFDDGPDHPVWADFQRKVAALEISQDERDVLLARAETALLENWGPVYRRLAESLEAQRSMATQSDSVSIYPDGDDFYADRLAVYTTTGMTAQEIHALGLSEVARIHEEMRGIMAEVDFDGTLQDFFEFMRTDPQFYYPNDDTGREEYLATATAIIDDMRERLPDYFGRLPQADIEVWRVEPFREQFAGKAFYENPALDGSRPGVYYANLYDMADMPIYQMATLAYHEGIPGHHMQRSIQQELDGIPMFRAFTAYTAYNEGWGLYAEFLPLEMGVYEDPYMNFGRLALELLRASRLVVDTGLHDQNWSREEAIAYMAENTPNPIGNITNEVERYVVLPGQATAYLIGKNRILGMRRTAEAALGDDFDIRAFHDLILSNGPLPLVILEEQVNDWIARQHSPSGGAYSGNAN